MPVGKPGNRETGKPGNRETGKPGNRETLATGKRSVKPETVAFSTRPKNRKAFRAKRAGPFRDVPTAFTRYVKKRSVP